MTCHGDMNVGVGRDSLLHDARMATIYATAHIGGVMMLSWDASYAVGGDDVFFRTPFT